VNTRELICVICPNGCQLRINIQEGEEPAVTDLTGHLCRKGCEWAKQEILNPMRNVSSSILVEQGDFPLVSVKTDSPVHLKNIFNVMKQIKTTIVKAPVKAGDIIIENVAGLKCNIIATKNINKV
jgi:CxxC motif-containing protein